MKKFRTGALVLALGAASLWVGCRIDAPTAARPHASGVTASANGIEMARAHGAPLVRCERRQAVGATAAIGRAGGAIDVGENRLIIPAGALGKRVTITATILGDTLAGMEFRPEKLRFAIPATLVLSARGCPRLPDSPHVDYFNRKEGKYKIIEQLPARYEEERLVVTTKISHFSGYAIAW